MLVVLVVVPRPLLLLLLLLPLLPLLLLLLLLLLLCPARVRRCRTNARVGLVRRTMMAEAATAAESILVGLLLAAPIMGLI